MELNAQMMAALRSFSVAARTGSFTSAGLELHISAAAISQQMANFEQQLQLTLFERHSRGIRLTSDGATLFATVSPCLENITNTINSLQKTKKLQHIKLKSTPSFAYKWLVPRLQNFYQRYPDITVQIFADGGLVDTNTTDFDIAIDYGPIPYQELDSSKKSRLLMAEFLVPVMNSAYAKKYQWQDLNTWQHVTLLHDAMPWRDAKYNSEWQYWFETMGLSHQLSTSGHSFNRTDMAMEAAAAGQGIALGRSALLEQDLLSGNLIAPFSPIAANCGYFLITTLNADITPDDQTVDCFVRWLFEQVAE
ncbi:MAG: LysR family transcriptional regulator [Gammaproteobacteria bacterium]|nr:LysR family transcriptional regulator [Gammaproteobacteria bacterium]